MGQKAQVLVRRCSPLKDSTPLKFQKGSALGKYNISKFSSPLILGRGVHSKIILGFKMFFQE